MRPLLPAERRFPASLALSAAFHAAVFLWIWMHRPQVIEVSLPGNLAVDMLAAEAPAAPAVKPVAEAPPQPVQKDEVVTPAHKAKPKPKPPPTRQRPVSQPPNPTPTATATQAPATSEAHVGLTGAPGLASDFPFSYYLIAVRNRIGTNWLQPGVDRRTKTTLFFRIARDGSVSDVRVEVPSGVPLFDQAAQRAVLASSPLPRLPQSFTRDELGVHFDFEVTR